MAKWSTFLAKAFSVPTDDISSVFNFKGTIRHKVLRSLSSRLEITQDDKYVDFNIVEGENSNGTYKHSQSPALATWTINHGLGFNPSVRVYGNGGREMLGEVIHASLNQALVYFDSPLSGFAVCS